MSYSSSASSSHPGSLAERGEPRRPYHVVVVGASGFTGQLTAKYLATKRHENANFTFALAARHTNDLNKLQQELVAIDSSLSDIAVLHVDSQDPASLDAIARQTRVIVNCAGPFMIHGPPIIEACIRAGTHYCDITGEGPFVQQSVRRYHEAGAQKGIHIVHACGLDSIPSDLGTLMLVSVAKEHNLELSNVEGNLAFKTKFSGGTLQTLLSLGDLPFETLKDSLRPFAFNPPGKHPAVTVADRDPAFIRFSSVVNAWTKPGMLSPFNTRIVRRSAALLDYGPGFHYTEREVVSRDKFTGFFFALFGYFLLIMTSLMALFSPTRALLKWFVSQSHEGTSEKEMREGWLHMTVAGHLSDNRKLLVTVRGGEPGYQGTARFLGEAGLCLALDQEKLPKRGGVLTPASSMGNVLINRLRTCGFSFQSTLPAKQFEDAQAHSEKHKISH